MEQTVLRVKKTESAEGNVKNNSFIKRNKTSIVRLGELIKRAEEEEIRIKNYSGSKKSHKKDKNSTSAP